MEGSLACLGRRVLAGVWQARGRPAIDTEYANSYVAALISLSLQTQQQLTLHRLLSRYSNLTAYRRGTANPQPPPISFFDATVCSLALYLHLSVSAAHAYCFRVAVEVRRGDVGLNKLCIGCRPVTLRLSAISSFVLDIAFSD